jgi:hypothetical protein
MSEEPSPASTDGRVVIVEPKTSLATPGDMSPESAARFHTLCQLITSSPEAAAFLASVLMKLMINDEHAKELADKEIHKARLFLALDRGVLHQLR